MESTTLRRYTLSWTHYVFLLGVKNPGELSFYEIEATLQKPTRNLLTRCTRCEWVKDTGSG